MFAAAIGVAVYVTIYIHRAIAAVDTAAARARDELTQKFEARCLALTAENVALKEEFARYREHALKHFMSKEGGSQAIDRVGKAVGELKQDLAERLKRLEGILLQSGQNGQRGQR